MDPALARARARAAAALRSVADLAPLAGDVADLLLSAAPDQDRAIDLARDAGREPATGSASAARFAAGASALAVTFVGDDPARALMLWTEAVQACRAARYRAASVRMAAACGNPLLAHLSSVLAERDVSRAADAAAIPFADVSAGPVMGWASSPSTFRSGTGRAS